MPRISEFFGIAIFMYWFDVQRHKKPHFHARHSGREAVFDLSGKIIEGGFGKRAEKLVKEWCLERQDELQNAWEHAVQGKEVPWIAPLQ